MGFNEKVHAYIAGRYYIHLTEAFGRRGEQAFLHATQYYALQRGRRMAQRAIRDGAELTQASYNYYGEWISNEDVKKDGTANVFERDAQGNMVVTVCPWYAQFKAMGLTDAGALYCSDLDSSISRGFNPALGYETVQTLHESECCIHRLKSGDIFEGSDKGKFPGGIKDFEYHCAHIYWSFREVAASIFKEEGDDVGKAVLVDVELEYGTEYAESIRQYSDTNFNVID